MWSVPAHHGQCKITLYTTRPCPALYKVLILLSGVRCSGHLSPGPGTDHVLFYEIVLTLCTFCWLIVKPSSTSFLSSINQAAFTYQQKSNRQRSAEILVAFLRHTYLEHNWFKLTGDGDY